MSELSREIIEAVKRQVAEEFPEMACVEPDVAPCPSGVDPRLVRKLGAAPPGRPARDLHTLTFTCSLTTEDGSSMPRVVRATVDSSGNVVKMTVSK
jgi:hypothetical protein